MSAGNNPWYFSSAADPPEWAMQRKSAPFKVECPECGAVARPFWVGADYRDVRCCRCNARFPAKGRVPPTREKRTDEVS